MRMGYFHESPLKGARQFLSLVVQVDVSFQLQKLETL
jgi:hypothetical protein